MIRMSELEKSAIEAEAAREGLPVATWARLSLLKHLRPDKTALNEQPQLRRPRELLSLFCGPGGLDTGFKEAGFNTGIAFDVDQECVSTFNRNHKVTAAVAHRADLRDLTVKEVLRLAGSDFRPVGVIGGPPCQSFSISNVFQTDDDPRHSLPGIYATLLKKLNREIPLSFFLFENVPGLLGVKHRHRYEEFKKMFESAGFEISESRLDAKDFGVPQQRDRIFIVGINRDLHPHAVWEWPKPRLPIQTVRETIGHLPEPIFTEAGRDPDTIPHHPNHWAMVPRSKKFSTAGALQEGSAFGRSFRTLSWDEPSWTVAYGNREVHVHPNGKRRLSIYEAMLLQTFPPDYQLTGNISAQIRLVSEAVAPRMAFFLALAIRSSLGI